jgi:hypothetical protein
MHGRQIENLVREFMSDGEATTGRMVVLVDDDYLSTAALKKHTGSTGFELAALFHFEPFGFGDSDNIDRRSSHGVLFK